LWVFASRAHIAVKREAAASSNYRALLDTKTTSSNARAKIKSRSPTMRVKRRRLASSRRCGRSQILALPLFYRDLRESLRCARRVATARATLVAKVGRAVFAAERALSDETAGVHASIEFFLGDVIAFLLRRRTAR
jgi:hypothetical protein